MPLSTYKIIAGLIFYLFVGPPDKKSNIRPILRHISINETPLQMKLRLRRIEVHDWVRRNKLLLLISKSLKLLSA